MVMNTLLVYMITFGIRVAEGVDNELIAFSRIVTLRYSQWICQSGRGAPSACLVELCSFVTHLSISLMPISLFCGSMISHVSRISDFCASVGGIVEYLPCCRDIEEEQPMAEILNAPRIFGFYALRYCEETSRGSCLCFFYSYET